MPIQVVNVKVLLLLFLFFQLQLLELSLVQLVQVYYRSLLVASLLLLLTINAHKVHFDELILDNSGGRAHIVGIRVSFATRRRMVVLIVRVVQTQVGIIGQMTVMLVLMSDQMLWLWRRLWHN